MYLDMLHVDTLFLKYVSERIMTGGPENFMGSFKAARRNHLHHDDRLRTGISGCRYNVGGAILWSVLFVGAGFFFGNLPFVQVRLGHVTSMAFVITGITEKF